MTSHLPTSIENSTDLATLLNVPGLTTEDQVETPLDPALCTKTLAVTLDGKAAARFYPYGKSCNGDHRTGNEYRDAHWCPANVRTVSWGEGEFGVRHDWRTVYLWAGGYSETTFHDTPELAEVAASAAVQDLLANDTDDA